jgi:hypothetical protein
MAAKKQSKVKSAKAGMPIRSARATLATALRSAMNMTAVATSSGSVLLVLLAAKRFV